MILMRRNHDDWPRRKRGDQSLMILMRKRRNHEDNLSHILVLLTPSSTLRLRSDLWDLPIVTFLTHLVIFTFLYFDDRDYGSRVYSVALCICFLSGCRGQDIICCK